MTKNMKEIFPQFEPVYKKADTSDVDRARWKMGNFSDSEKETIEKKRQLLSTLAYFIGKDFQMPVELNAPGEGWHWDFAKNVVRIDPIDLLEKPLDHLRFVISHEGGHRRISRTEFIPTEVWRKPGFSFMMNAVEDPRDNNFVAENYPKFKEQMRLAYDQDLDAEAKAKVRAKGKLGYQPLHLQAGFEYIKQWFKEVQGEKMDISPELPEPVKSVLAKTLESARDSWWLYPSKAEADKSEELIKKYAKKSYEINLAKIWPEYQKLVERDMADQKMQEFMKDMQKSQAAAQKSAGGNEGLPQDLKDKLSAEEEQALEKALDEAKAREKPNLPASETPPANQPELNNGGEGEGKPENSGEGQNSGGRSVNLESLPEALKQKIKDYINSLPESRKKELAEKAEQELKDFDKSVSKDLAGKIADDPEKKQAREQGKEAPREPKDRPRSKEAPKAEKSDKARESLSEVRDQIEKSLNRDNNAYEERRREVMPVISRLEMELREIFVRRQANKWQGGFRVGKKIDLGKRMQEKAKGLSAM